MSNISSAPSAQRPTQQQTKNKITMTMTSLSESDPPPKESPPNPDDTSDGSEQKAAIAINSRGGSSGLSASQVEKRRDFTKKQNLRRQVYREMTVFQIYPLQAMAMDDLDLQLQDYCSNGFQGDGSDGADEDSDGSESVPRRATTLVAGKQSHAPPESECDLRKQFMREFMEEKSFQVPDGVDVDVDATVEVPVEPQANTGQVDDPTQKGENESSAAAGDGGGEGEADSIEKIATNKSSPHDKERVSQTSAEPDSQSELCHSEEQQQQQQNEHPKTESTSPSSKDQQHTQNEQKHPFLSTLWSLEPRIWAMESAIKGKRRYISAHLGRFMDHYWRECDVYNRHYYELIREDSPCRLYFDLEFNKRSNPDLTSTVTEDLLTELFEELTLQFQIIYKISIERSGMVDLDSSTPKKFSRHWILHLPNGELFSDAREAGIFVKGLVSRLEEEQQSGKLQSRGQELLANHLFVNAEDSEEGNVKLTRFIDLGVYTRNRIFRILGSTKFGKPTDAALRIAEANEFPFPSGFDNAKFYLPAMNTALSSKLDINRGNDATGVDDSFESFCNSLSWEDHATALAATLVVPANASKMLYPTLNDPSNLLSDEEKQQVTTLRTLNGSDPCRQSKFPRAALSYGKSPLPQLEHFIVNTLGKREGLVGTIGTWSLGTQQPLPQTVSYNMKDNRYCEHIGRAHKSNNVIWNVHLIDRIVWQSCHDPECRGFRGRAIDLPEEVNLEIDDFFLDYELSSLNENEIIENKENEQESPKDEFDDPALELAMCQLDISSLAREKEAEELDDELAKLNLSDIVSSRCRMIEPLSDLKNGNFDVSSQAKETDNKSHDTSTLPKKFSSVKLED